MVDLKLPDDGHKRNPCHGFVALATSLTPRYFDTWVVPWDLYGENYDWGDRPKPKPLRNVLTTPVYQPSNGANLKNLKALKDQGYVDHVMFDSGGFQVLTGSLEDKGVRNLDDLQRLNEELYNREDWADVYIMPDHPASRADMHSALDPDYNTFQEKAKHTVEATLKFYECLKPEIQDRAAPVFHLQRETDIDFFLDAYKPILDRTKFASFSASSLTHAGASRTLKPEVIRILDTLLKRLEPEGIKLHCLGLAAPSAVFCMHYMGVTTFDANTPIIGAAVGKIFFPYFGSLSCSNKREDEANNLDQADLDYYKEKTGHYCHSCERVENFKDERTNLTEDKSVASYVFRALHNMIVLDELNWHYRDLDLMKLKEMAPLMYKNFTETLNLDSQMSFL